MSSLEPLHNGTTVKVIDQAKTNTPSTDNHILMLVLIGVGAGACLSLSIAIGLVIVGHYSKRRKVDKLDPGVTLY